MSNKLNKIISLAFISTIFCFELPWETASVGIMGGAGNSATFNTKNILYGMDIFTFGMNIEETQDMDEISVSAIVLMPKVGYKIDQRSVNRLNTYYLGEIYLAIPFFSITAGDEEFDDMEDDIVDIIDNLGVKISYGIEYKFNDQLSLSTDIGFNMLFNSVDIEGNDLQARLGNTFTKLSLNFSL